MTDIEKTYENAREMLDGMKSAVSPSQQQLDEAKSLLKKLDYDDLYNPEEMDMYEVENLIEELKDECRKKGIK